MNNIRIIETIRGERAIKKAIAKNHFLIYREVKPHEICTGKYKIVRHKFFRIKFKLYDYRDRRSRSESYTLVKDWTYTYYTYNFPKVAAYLIPKDIQENEIVFVKDLIENYIGFTYNQGGSDRLRGCKAIWENNDLKILYDPRVNILRAMG